MGMTFSDADDEAEVIGTINTTPLVDVMLVLLIIFLITIPVVTHTVPVKLPDEVVNPYKTKPDNIVLAVNKQGDVFWNEKLVPNTAELLTRLKASSIQEPQPQVHIRGDQATRYEAIGKVILAAQRAGISKVSFITQPPARA
jgi:biopolymer transport protein ExbD